jgi:hypothetical protein
MPLIRKPSGPIPEPPAASLTASSSDERWVAARAAANAPDGVALLTTALARENDPRVQEAIFSALARIATTESAAAVLPYLRSNDASLRTRRIASHAGSVGRALAAPS